MQANHSFILDRQGHVFSKATIAKAKQLHEQDSAIRAGFDTCHNSAHKDGRSALNDAVASEASCKSPCTSAIFDIQEKRVSKAEAQQINREQRSAIKAALKSFYETKSAPFFRDEVLIPARAPILEWYEDHRERERDFAAACGIPFVESETLCALKRLLDWIDRQITDLKTPRALGTPPSPARMFSGFIDIDL
jgi:hypothetical protein